ncbi:hypothetical protein HK097_003658, partial [Rhizophlyctis rosea]
MSVGHIQPIINADVLGAKVAALSDEAYAHLWEVCLAGLEPVLSSMLGTKEQQQAQVSEEKTTTPAYQKPDQLIDDSEKLCIRQPLKPLKNPSADQHSTAFPTDQQPTTPARNGKRKIGPKTPEPEYARKPQPSSSRTRQSQTKRPHSPIRRRLSSPNVLVRENASKLERSSEAIGSLSEPSAATKAELAPDAFLQALLKDGFLEFRSPTGTTEEPTDLRPPLSSELRDLAFDPTLCGPSDTLLYDALLPSNEQRAEAMYLRQTASAALTSKIQTLQDTLLYHLLIEKILHANDVDTAASHTETAFSASKNIVRQQLHAIGRETRNLRYGVAIALGASEASARALQEDITIQSNDKGTLFGSEKDIERVIADLRRSGELRTQHLLLSMSDAMAGTLLGPSGSVIQKISESAKAEMFFSPRDTTRTLTIKGATANIVTTAYHMVIRRLMDEGHKFDVVAGGMVDSATPATPHIPIKYLVKRYDPSVPTDSYRPIDGNANPPSFRPSTSRDSPYHTIDYPSSTRPTTYYGKLMPRDRTDSQPLPFGVCAHFFEHGFCAYRNCRNVHFPGYVEEDLTNRVVVAGDERMTRQALLEGLSAFGRVVAVDFLDEWHASVEFGDLSSVKACLALPVWIQGCPMYCNPDEQAAEKKRNLYSDGKRYRPAEEEQLPQQAMTRQPTYNSEFIYKDQWHPARHHVEKTEPYGESDFYPPPVNGCESAPQPMHGQNPFTQSDVYPSFRQGRTPARDMQKEQFMERMMDFAASPPQAASAADVGWDGEIPSSKRRRIVVTDGEGEERRVKVEAGMEKRV